MSEFNEFIDILHAFEQLEATMRDLAPVLGTYRRSLHKEGFTREESLAMAITFQSTLFTQQYGGEASDSE